MRKIILSVAFFGLITTASSQKASVEKSVSGIQFGTLGFWFHNETKLSNQIVLRGEVGLDSGIWGGDYYDKVGFLMAPVITAEPRWYYSLNKRVRKSRRIEGNSGSFISLKNSYHPDWFVISNNDNVRVISDISIIPTWGIRRNIGKHFNYEAGFGVGYQYFFTKQVGYLKDETDVAYNLHLRIGYQF